MGYKDNIYDKIWMILTCNNIAFLLGIANYFAAELISLIIIVGYETQRKTLIILRKECMCMFSYNMAANADQLPHL